jgi:glucose-6-phosphate 1-dehydrogenase
MQTITPKERPDPCVLVIFGASGDLTARKLVPALYELDRDGRLPKELCVLGVSRTEMSDQAWRDRLYPTAKEHARGFDDEHWAWFAGRLHYLAGSATERDLYPVLAKRINELGVEHGMCREGDISPNSPWATQPNVMYYLAVAPNLLLPIVEKLGATGMVYEGKRWCALNPQRVPWQRLIIEKPFGSDEESAHQLNQAVGRVFEEDAVYRIDHYLGKELVQNILVMRFANTLFEPIWNNQYVDHVQVSAIESVGVGKRAANFYDVAGACRDMVQSHLLQVMALVAMEPPVSYDAVAIRREKHKLLESVRLMDETDAAAHSAFGVYGPSGDANDDDEGRGYWELPKVDTSKRIETYAAMRLDIQNWRWAGVPFFVRSGKKLARKLTEIVIQLKRPPADLFRDIDGLRGRPANRIVINIAPDDGVSLRFEAKVPGPVLKIESVKADFDYQYVFDSEAAEAYGLLMLDAIRGDQTLFKHRDEVVTAWRIVDPAIRSRAVREAVEVYNPGTWGPASADQLIARGAPHRRWHNPDRQEKR